MHLGLNPTNCNVWNDHLRSVRVTKTQRALVLRTYPAWFNFISWWAIEYADSHYRDDQWMQWTVMKELDTNNLPGRGGGVRAHSAATSHTREGKFCAFREPEAKLSQSVYWGAETCAKRKSTSPCLLAIPALDRIARLSNRQLNCNRGLCLR